MYLTVEEARKRFAYVAIRRERGDATFAYLPHPDVPLPFGWKWNIVNGEVDKMDITHWIDRGMSVYEICRMICTGTQESHSPILDSSPLNLAVSSKIVWFTQRFFFLWRRC